MMLTAIKTMTPTMSTIFLENIDLNGSEFLHPKAITAYFLDLGFGFKHGHRNTVALCVCGAAVQTVIHTTNLETRITQPEPFRL